MDFSSFNLESDGHSFKHTYDDDGNNDFFNFMNDTSNNNTDNTTYENGNFTPTVTTHESPSPYTTGVLSSQTPSNTDYMMSPLQIAPQQALMPSYHTPLQQPLHVEDFADEEEFFTPLVSPAMAPTYDPNYLVMNNAQQQQIFSPLSSPALHPSPSNGTDSTTLQQKLAFIERQQQQLRNMHNQLRPAGSPDPKKPLKKLLQSPRPFVMPKSKSDSPLALKPMTPHTSFVNQSPTMTKHSPFISPATPSLLMKLGSGMPASGTNTNYTSTLAVDHMPVLPDAMIQPPSPSSTIDEPDIHKRRRISQTSPPSNYELSSPAGLRPQQSPRALKPFISPSLKPNGKRLSSIEEETARALLTSKSNYENLKEGKAKSLGIDFSTTIQSGIENRRSAHKAAEQKRRDTLKQSFDSLRTEIIEAMVTEEENGEMDRQAKEKDVKQMSKVVLLQHSYEYILRLKNDNKRKDQKQLKMRTELMTLRKQLGLPEITEEEKEEERKEALEEEERKQARLKRLQTAAAVGAGEEDP